ncbi:MAG: DUF2993 domain-containing protein [Pegethrix bostrychoides GSE-TBD4-15B]|uniref:DUF2993 domain-containing protein n=1 Tax=Pegethrix bostrychoides GSE-TBD4-15B TaxID=2839662 RepID=A0A951P7Z7_9CYAN|nr:DUF2993 domain-containing protein [Pegethrix bostrychoides GSE-TBD4-15B]
MAVPIENPIQPQSDEETQAGSQLLSRILAPAVKLWLRSQIESAESLEFQISGRNRQLLQGQVPAVQVSAAAVVYQGLQLSQARIKASQIQINLSQVMQGKPLRLLKPVLATGQICLTQADLTASSESPLLRQALSDLLQLLLQRGNLGIETGSEMTLHYPSLLLGQNQFTLIGELVAPMPNSPERQRWQFKLEAALSLAAPAQLELSQLTLETARLHQPPTQISLPPLSIDLGASVNIERLEITPAQIICSGAVEVLPS